MERDPAIEEALVQLARVGAATHAVRLSQAAPDEFDALDAAVGEDRSATRASQAMALLCAVCPGQVTRLRSDLFAIDARDMAAELLKKAPALLTRRLFGPGYEAMVAIEALDAAERSPYAEAAKEIDWMACEVRIEDVAADLSRRAEAAGQAQLQAQDAVRSHALEAIETVKTESLAAARSASDAAAERIETRIHAVLERVATKSAEPSLEANIAALGESVDADDAEALRGALDTLRTVMADLRGRSSDVGALSERLNAMRAAFDAERAEAAAAALSNTSAQKPSGSALKLTGAVAPFGPIELPLSDDPYGLGMVTARAAKSAEAR